jgi:hypothetical protein
MKRSSGTPSNLCESVHQQLTVYAGAAVVAVMSVLALAQPSEAKIVYTPANVVVKCTGRFCDPPYHLDLNNDGVTDFTIQVTSFIGGVCDGDSYVTEVPASGNGAIGSGGYAAALVQGAPIGHSQQFQGGKGTMAWSDTVQFPYCHTTHGGASYGVTNRYLGLSFQRNGRIHYGWARLNVWSGNVDVILTGYAYETIAGKSIKAGQTKGPADDPTNEDFNSGASLTSPIPDKPASLGTLALGAQGVPLWRRKESALEGD